VELALRGFVARFPAMACWRAGLACLYVEAGRAGEAREELQNTLSGGIGSIRRDVNWLVTIALLAQVASGVRDSAASARLYDTLLPYDGRQVTIGLGIADSGSVAHYLGIAAAAAGRLDRAERHFQDALATHRRMGARAFEAYTLYEHAAAVRGEGDVRRARELAHAAGAIAQDIGMKGLLALGDSVIGEPASAAGA
jgi:hypothetical protein